MSHNRQPASRRFVASVALSAAIALVAGCKKEEAAPPKAPDAKPAPAAAPPAAANTTHTIEGVTFSYPAGWKVSPGVQPRSVDVEGPADGEWQPSALVTVLPDAEKRSLDDLMDANREILAAKDAFQVRRRESGETPGGVSWVRTEYQYNDDRKSVALQAVSAFLKVGERRVQVQAITGADTWSKYEPAFNELIASVKAGK